MKQGTSSRVGKLKSGAVMLGLGLMLAATSGAAFADHAISGTYAVKFDRLCVRSPGRLNALPSFFHYTTPDTQANGFLQAPPGMSTAEANAVTVRTAESGSYIMVVNPINNTMTLSNGTYHSIPMTVFATAPSVTVSDFGTFTGTGTFAAALNSPQIDVMFHTFTTAGDNSLTDTTNVKYRLETRDKGDSFFSVVGRGSIRLQHNLTGNFYRDTHCTGLTTGTRISKSY